MIEVMFSFSAGLLIGAFWMHWACDHGVTPAFVRWHKRKAHQNASYKFGIIVDKWTLFHGTHDPDTIAFFAQKFAQRWRSGWRPESIIDWNAFSTLTTKDESEARDD